MKKSALLLTVCFIAVIIWFNSGKTPKETKAVTTTHAHKHQSAKITPAPDPSAIILEKCIEQFKAQTPIGKLKGEMCDKAVAAFATKPLPESIDEKDYNALKEALLATQ